MSFETPEKIQTITQALQKIVFTAVEGAEQARDDQETKMQVLQARAVKFKAQQADLAGEINQLRQEINKFLNEGGDPGKINRQVRAKEQEAEDLAGWIAQLEKVTIPAAEKALSEATIKLWRVLIDAVRTARPSFDKELSDHLALAAELSDSWKVVVHNLFKSYRTGREPSGAIAGLIVDPKRTDFFGAIR